MQRRDTGLHRMTQPRPLSDADILPLARLWYDVWHETQAGPLPEELAALRTLPDFERRLRDVMDDVRAIGPVEDPGAFCAIRETPADPSGTVELYQLFVGQSLRRTGAGRMLMSDAESRMRAAGHTRAHLKCLTENTTALRFYESCGWVTFGIQDVMLDTSAGPFKVACTVLKKEL